MIVTRSLYTVGKMKFIDIDGVPYHVLWRYKRPVCETSGIKTIYEFTEGSKVVVTSENTWGRLTLKSIRDEQ